MRCVNISEVASTVAHAGPEPEPEPEPDDVPETAPEPPVAQPDYKEPSGSVHIERPDVYLVKVKLTERWLNDYKSQGSNKYDRLTKQITNSVSAHDLISQYKPEPNVIVLRHVC